MTCSSDARSKPSIHGMSSKNGNDVQSICELLAAQDRFLLGLNMFEPVKGWMRRYGPVEYIGLRWSSGGWQIHPAILHHECRLMGVLGSVPHVTLGSSLDAWTLEGVEQVPRDGSVGETNRKRKDGSRTRHLRDERTRRCTGVFWRHAADAPASLA